MDPGILMAVFNQARLPNWLLTDFLFQTWYDLAIYIFAGLNDVVGFKKDATTGATNNMIMINIIKEGISAEESFNREVKILW